MNQTGEKVSGTIYQRVNNNYIVDLDNGDRVNISVDTMTHSVMLDSLMIDGTIPNGARMNFYIGNSGVYPDRETYPLKETFRYSVNVHDDYKSVPQDLLEGIKPYQQPCVDRATFMDEIIPMFDKMKADTLEKVFIILKSNQPEADMQNQIRTMLNMPAKIQVEGVNFERKSSFLHTPGDSAGFTNKTQQIREIADELLSIANSGHKGTVVVGVDDKTGEVKGLEREIAEAYPGMSVNKFQDTVVCNVFRSYVKDDVFMNSLSFDWRNLNGHLVCFITIDYVSGMIICLPDGDIPYRTDSSKSTVHGKDAIRFAWNMGVAYGQRKTMLA